MKAENVALPGTPKVINFSATAEADAAAQLAFTTQPSGANSAGTAFGTQPVIEIQDSSGNLILGTDPLISGTVILEMHDNVSCTSAHGGTFNSSSIAASSGTATFVGANYETAGTGLYIKASLGALTVACSSVLVVDHAVADHLTLSQGNGQSATVNSSVATAPEVVVQDAYGNTVDAYTVNFSILTGAGSVGAATDSSDASGLAAVSWTLGTSAGANTMKAENVALPGTPKLINFSATGNGSGC